MMMEAAVKLAAREALAVDMSAPLADSIAAGEADDRAEAFSLQIKRQMDQQFQMLKDQSQALFGMVDGRPGVRSPAEWAKLVERAGDEIGSGQFIVRCIGAERYLDALTVAVLITFRQNLIADLGKPSTADIMIVNGAVLAYYNMLRVQGWIGNAALVVEREYFGQTPLGQIHGPESGERLRVQLDRLAEVMLPLQDRCHRMLVRSLAELPRSARKSRMNRRRKTDHS